MDSKKTKGPGRPPDASLGKRRREEILDTATRIFAQRGYRNTDVQVIADTLGVGKGTVYRYFSTKEKLFLAGVDRGMRCMQRAVDEVVTQIDDPFERFRASIFTCLEYFSKHPELVELFIQERAAFRDRARPSFAAHIECRVEPWKKVLREQIARGRVRDIPVDRLTTLVSNLLYGTMFTNHFFGNTKPAAQQAEEIIDIIFHGMLTEQQQKQHSMRQQKSK